MKVEKLAMKRADSWASQKNGALIKEGRSYTAGNRYQTKAEKKPHAERECKMKRRNLIDQVPNYPLLPRLLILSLPLLPKAFGTTQGCPTLLSCTLGHVLLLALPWPTTNGFGVPVTTQMRRLIRSISFHHHRKRASRYSVLPRKEPPRSTVDPCIDDQARGDSYEPAGGRSSAVESR